MVGAGTETHPGSCPLTTAAAHGRGGGASPKLSSPWMLAAPLLRWSDSDKPASALCAGSYNLTSVLPTAPDMAQFKRGEVSCGKLSVFANELTSIQVSEMGMMVTEFDGGFVVFENEIWTLFNCQRIRFYILDLCVCW